MPENDSLLRGIDHVALLVEDIDAVLDHYVGNLHMRLISDDRMPTTGARLAYLDGGGTMLQLVQPIAPGPLADHLSEQGEGLHHVCFAVDRLEPVVAAMAPGAETQISMGGRGRRTVFLPKVQFGLRTELTEVEPYQGGGHA